jgi:hypothetical protein
LTFDFGLDLDLDLDPRPLDLDIGIGLDFDLFGRRNDPALFALAFTFLASMGGK